MNEVSADGNKEVLKFYYKPAILNVTDLEINFDKNNERAPIGLIIFLCVLLIIVLIFVILLYNKLKKVDT